MRMKRAVAVEPDKTATPSTSRRLIDDLSVQELEPLAIEVIREHRRRLKRAQDLFEAIEREPETTSPGDEFCDRRQDYRMALLNLNAQHELVRIVVDALGYVPEVDGEVAVSLDG